MERDLPDIARRGKLIEKANPQAEIRKVAETANWDFQQEATKLYRRADVIIDRFYPVIHTPHFQGRLPSVLIAIDSERNKKVLASYRLVPDEYGLSFKINMNKQHYIDEKDAEGNKYKTWRRDETMCRTGLDRNPMMPVRFEHGTEWLVFKCLKNCQSEIWVAPFKGIKEQQNGNSFWPFRKR